MRKDSFNMTKNGKIVGYWIWETEVNEKEIILKDISVLFNIIQEEFVLKMDKKNLVSKMVDMKMKGSNFSLDVAIQRKSSLDLKGNFSINNGNLTEKKIDTTYTSRVILRPEIFGLIHTITDPTKLDEKINTFFLSSALAYEMKLMYAGDEVVTVPAGTFDCHKVTFRSGIKNVVSNIIYISKQFPKRIVKVEVVDQPLIIELVKL
ncbi:DUF3108 domain-containing protein [Winogradskyella haliclonae]|nr:hypothetical protein [Winogradskyella haliclonae]